MQEVVAEQGALIHFHIDFAPNEGRPQRVFESAAGLVSAFEILDTTLSQCIGSISTDMRLERVEAGSLKGFLRTVLSKIDDSDLQDLNVKRVIGKFLVEAKYEVLAWANADENQRSPHRLVELADKIHRIAEQTDVKQLPDYTKPSIKQLANGISKVSQAKECLGDEDRMYLVSDDRKLEVTAKISWPPDELLEVLTEELVSALPGRTVLVIKKPDFLGKSKWQMMYKGHTARIKIADHNWLMQFQLGQTEPVGPGDALEVDLAVEHRRDKKGHIIEEKLTVTKVHAIHHKEFQMHLLD